MLTVKKQLCLGCGLCVQNCPQGAISLLCNQAWIDQSECNSCRLCLEVCPQGAIAEVVPVSAEELRQTLASLRERTEDILSRLGKIKVAAREK